MNKKNWITPEVIILGIENTEANTHCGKLPDGNYCDYCGHELHS